MKLTGKYDFRRGWRGKMILQVEIEYYKDVDNGYGLGSDSELTTTWRDATGKEAYELLRDKINT